MERRRETNNCNYFTVNGQNDKVSQLSSRVWNIVPTRNDLIIEKTHIIQQPLNYFYGIP